MGKNYSGSDYQNRGAIVNARITKRSSTEVSNDTPSINSDNIDYHSITALAAAMTSFTVTGTPTQGQELLISITDNGTARALTFGANFEASGIALPTTTIISVRMDIRFIWNSATSKWRIVSISQSSGGGGLSDGDYGDVVVSGSGSVLTVETATGNFAVLGDSFTHAGAGDIPSNFSAGENALANNTSGVGNTATGQGSLGTNTTANLNTATGVSALANSNSANNSAHGASSLGSVTSGNNNTANGYNSGPNIDTGSKNTLAGANTGGGITSGSSNTILGANVSGLAGGLSNNVILADGDGNIRAQHNATEWNLNRVASTRIVPRISTEASNTEPSIATDSVDSHLITALAGNIATAITWTGTPANQQKLIVSITDDGTARTLSWNASKFESSGGATLPTTTVLGVRLDVGFIYNTATGKFRCIAVA